MSAGLGELRALHELVEAALPNSVKSRANFVFPPSPPVEGEAALAEVAQQPAGPPPPRPLALELAESRSLGKWGLRRGRGWGMAETEQVVAPAAAAAE
jgi:hypothetical protein